MSVTNVNNMNWSFDSTLPELDQTDSNNPSRHLVRNLYSERKQALKSIKREDVIKDLRFWFGVCAAVTAYFGLAVLLIWQYRVHISDDPSRSFQFDDNHLHYNFIFMMQYVIFAAAIRLIRPRASLIPFVLLFPAFLTSYFIFSPEGDVFVILSIIAITCVGALLTYISAGILKMIRFPRESFFGKKYSDNQIEAWNSRTKVFQVSKNVTGLFSSVILRSLFIGIFASAVFVMIAYLASVILWD